jgi:hypothetical protein
MEIDWWQRREFVALFLPYGPRISDCPALLFSRSSQSLSLLLQSSTHAWSGASSAPSTTGQLNRFTLALIDKESSREG